MSDKNISDLYKNKQYDEGIQYGENPIVRDSFNDWDYLFYANCFYRLKRYADFLNVYKEFHKKFPTSTLLDDNMGWSLYHVHIKTFDYEHGDKALFLKQIDFVISHSSDSEYSPKTWVATYAAGAIFKKKFAVNPDYELGNKYLSVIDPSKLSLEEHENNVNGRIMKTASDREKWYNWKLKALVELKQYDECLKYADEALSNINKFHNNANHWINYRKALCYIELGDYDSAEVLANQVLKSFKHWCFLEILFKISIAKNDYSSAIKYGCRCATADPEHKLRVTFYENFATYLLDKGKENEAALHFRLVEIIREEENWKIINLPSNFTYPADISSLGKKEILKRLSAFWNDESNTGIKFYDGTIVTILPNGQSGFIQDATGNRYYFRIQDFSKKVRDLKEGTRVRYTLVDRLDKKKNEMKPNAVEISIIK